MIQYIKEENTIKVKLLPCPIVIKGGDGEQSDWLEEDTESLAYIKNKPTNVSSFNNDVGYLTEHQDLSDYVKEEDLATVATTGDYNDLDNKPTIPTVNDATITLTQGGTIKGSFTLNQGTNQTIDLDAGGVSSVDCDDIQDKPSFATVATTGDYDDLDNKPTIPTVDYPVTDVQVNSSSVVNNKVANITVPTDTGDLTNNAGYITGIDSNDVTTALGYTPGTSNFSGSYTDLSNKPTIPDDLADLNDDSTHRLVTDTEKTTWNNKSNFSGSYNDLTDKPTIPSAGIPGGGNAGQVLKKVSATDYDVTWSNQSETLPSAYCTTAGGTAAKRANCSLYVTQANQYLQVLIGSANTYQGALTLNINSAGAKPIYINGTASSSSNYTLPNGTYFVFYDGTNYYFRTDGKLTMPNAAFSGSYTELADKPSIPTKTSDLNNDSGFISSETDPTVPSWAKSANKPTYTASEVGALPDTTAIPTNTSDLNNDSGFITSETDPVFSASAAAGIQSSDITAWNGKQDPASTLSGYGITDASINSRTVTLGSNSVYVPNILSGNSAPTSGQGSDGDLYLQLV